jgi:hypothetical protein
MLAHQDQLQQHWTLLPMVSVPQVQTLQGHHRLVRFVVPRKRMPIQQIASLFKIENGREISLCDLNKKEKPNSREMPWNSPSPKRIPRTSSCRTSLSSPRSCSAAARIIGISESSIPSDDTLGCGTERDECSRMKCRSREILSYA